MKVSYHTLKKDNVADFLILTVTDKETEQLMPLIEPISDAGLLEAEHDGRLYTIGKIGQFNIIHCKCSNMGSQEKGASILTTRNALGDWPCIKAVIMVGIAFGMYDEAEGDAKQRFSDVLVSRSVFPYDNQKLKSGIVEFRGEWHDADKTFINAFEEISKTWSIENLFGDKVRIEVAPLLSGEKLIDDKDERNKLRDHFKESRGGEMEGIGLASACNDASKPWILVKAICDFGDGNKAERKHEKQDNAALSACLALKSVLQRDDLIISICNNSKSEFYYRPNRLLEEIVLFDDYTLDCEPFYIKRHVDDLILNATKVKGCWVYGKSGAGKTVALMRSLELMEVRSIFIDLATMVNQPVEKMFRYIYEEACDYFGVQPNSSYIQLHELARAIAELIDDHISEGDFYIVIEELPLSEEHGDYFADFVQQLCSLVISRPIKASHVNIKFMLSSITSPLEAIHDIQQKVKTYVKFIEVEEWEPEECIELWGVINNEMHYQLTDLSENEFVAEMDYSPRTMKDCLRSHSLLNIKSISKATIASM